MKHFKQLHHITYIAIFFLIVLNTNAQDTLFYRSLPIDKYVRNISTDGQNLYLRIGDSIYSFRNDEKKFIIRGALRFSWIKQNDYDDNYFWHHDNQISNSYKTSENELIGVLPGPPNAFITKAQIFNDLFICYNGNVLQYKINDLLKLVYRSKSIRNIYSDNHLRIISTYSGVFSEQIIGEKNRNRLEFNGKNIFPFSHGEFIKIRSDYYLCQSTKVYKYHEEENKFEEFQNFQENGQVKQLIEFGNKVVMVAEDGLVLLDLKEKKASEPIIKDKITRAKKIGYELIVVTKTGAIYRVSEKFKIDKIQTNYSYEDVEKINDEIFIGGESGLFKLNGDDVIKLNSAMSFFELHDFNGNLICSNYTGLYAWINSSAIPIIKNIEFNKYALSHDKLLFYAGSINGLYIIRNTQFDVWINNEKSKTNYEISTETKITNYSIYGLLALVLISLIAIMIKQRNRFDKKTFVLSKNEFSIEFINQTIREHNIISVEGLAEQLNISRVQLNRKLSKKGTSGLKVLKDCKRRIAIELYKDGVPVEKISKKLGYSSRYIKENFLNKS